MMMFENDPNKVYDDCVGLIMKYDEDDYSMNQLI